MWPSLPLHADLKNSPSLQTFNAKLNPHLFQFSTRLSALFVHAYCHLSHSLCVWGVEGLEGWNCGIMNNMMRLFSLLYIAASYTVHVYYFSLCIVSCHICGVFLLFFLRHSLIIFSINVENVGECCKAQ